MFVLARHFAAEPEGRAWARYCWITGTLSLVLEIGSNIGSPLAEKHGLTYPSGSTSAPASSSAGSGWP